MALQKVEINELLSLTLFKGISGDDLSDLGDQAFYYNLNAGEEVKLRRRERGTSKKYIYIIQKGYVTVKITSRYNDEYSFLAWRGKGQILGEGSLIRSELKAEDNFPVDYYPPASIPKMVATDPCQLIGFPTDIFKETAEKSRLVYRNLVLILSDKIFRERSRTHVIQTEGTSAVPRVARTLKNLEVIRGFRADYQTVTMSNGKIADKILDGTIKTVDIAGYIGISSESVGDALRALREAKIIYYTANGLRRGEIYIVNSKELAEF